MTHPSSPNTTEPNRADSAADTVPVNVRVLRTLGNGRAAVAQAVESRMPSGEVVQCVEKVFSPGLLTRLIYRLSFQSPFAYQSNRDAALACFYRRRVAAAILANSDVDVAIADPLYVRFDQERHSWVLAAKWIQGRGIKPAEPDGKRFRRFLLRSNSERPNTSEEVDQLVETMHQLETVLDESGLVGSGWQVAPRAMVSTANLLRVDDRYTIIDLESGIPAVLVPQYLFGGLRRAELPPFDDLDADKLRSWRQQNEKKLTFRIGPERATTLESDIEHLIHHTIRWKDSELALFRRPWRLLRRDGMRPYQEECIRRWRQDGVVDDETFASLADRSIRMRLIWYAGLLPSFLGRFSARLLGRQDYRERLSSCLRNRAVREEHWRKLIERNQKQWADEQRLPNRSRLSKPQFLLHSVLSRITPTRMHRYLSDRQLRRERRTTLLLLMLSPRYQAWLGQSRVESSIERWLQRDRITFKQADELRQDLSGNEVRAYTRGFGMHLALKALGPLIAPAKYGGLAAFIASGNLWFLLPLFFTPLLRTLVTLTNWWTTRHEHIPHGEALVMGLLPNVGSLAFPLQMFSARSRLSTFLIRDAASKLGHRIPIYGGSDSRTELALIRATDWLVELMEVISGVTQRIWPVRIRATQAPRTRSIHLKRTKFGRWLDQQATLAIQKAASGSDDLPESESVPSNEDRSAAAS